MRKVILMTAMFLLLSYSSTVQAGPIEGRGNIAVELSMSAFDESGKWINPGYIRGRYFLPTLGLRLSVGSDMLFSTDKEDKQETVKNLSFIDVRPGMEFYVSHSDKALAFVGFDLIIASRSSSLEANVGAPITGAWNIDDLENRGFTAFGVNLLTGGDYLLSNSGFFVGMEIGVEFLYFINHEVKWAEQQLVPETNSAHLKPNGLIRFGFVF